MAQGKRFDDWDRASLIAWISWNDPRSGRPWKPLGAFNPLLPESQTRESKKPTAFSISDPRDLAAVMGGTIETVK